MKQLLFMIALTLVGTFGSFLVSPFLGVAIYYLFAVLRPQFLWQWALPPDIPWSFYVAVATILATIIGAPGTPQPTRAQTPGADETRRRSLFSSLHIRVLLFGGWVLLTCLTAQLPSVSYPWFVEYIKILVMFTIATLVVRTMRHIWVLLVLMAVALGYIAYEVNALYLLHGYLGIYFNGYGGLDNNGAGLMLAMGVPLCFFIWEGSTRPWRWVFAALIPVLIHAVLMTYSRGAMVSLLAVSPLLYWRTRRRGQVTLAALGLLLLLPIMAGPEIRTRFFSIQQYRQEETAQSRFGSWAAGWEMAKDYPVLGVGFRNADAFSYQYGADMEGRVIHSQYLQILADTGFVGLTLYLSVLVGLWRNLARVRRSTRKPETEVNRQVYAVACGVESAMAVFCTGGLFLSLETFELPYLLLLLGAQLPSALAAVTERAASADPAAGLTASVASSRPTPRVGFARPVAVPGHPTVPVPRFRASPRGSS